jgi:hypothetical protein
MGLNGVRTISINSMLRRPHNLTIILVHLFHLLIASDESSIHDLCLLLLRLLRYPRQPIKQYRTPHIKTNIHPHQAKVPPAVRIRTIQARQENICVRDSTELAVARCSLGGVREVAAKGRYIRLQISTTVHPRRRIEIKKLNIRALHVRVRETRREHPVDKVREWRDAVHEDPEAGQGRGAGEHAVEDQC